jgi:aromatic ring-opening dioxygenase catalytic subunit (LigB family)
VVSLLAEAGIGCGIETTRGFDHGVFVPLKVAFPAADIPCVQLSLRSDLDPAAHLAAGRALAPLRDEGVLIIGSGNTYHNMAVMMRAMRTCATQTHGLDFDQWLAEAVYHPDAAERERRLAAWSAAPGARDAAPREEHLMPLLVASGAGGTDPGAKIFENRVLGAVQSAFRFG